MLIENTTLYNLGTQTIDLAQVQVVEDPRSLSDPDFPVPKKFGFIVYLGTCQITTDYLSLAAATSAHCEFHKAWVKVKTLPKPPSLEASSSSYTYVSEGHYHNNGWATFVPTEDEHWYDDRETWLKVGKALYREFDGKPSGMLLW